MFGGGVNVSDAEVSTLKPIRGPMSVQQAAIRLLVCAARPRATPEVYEALREAISICSERDLADTAKQLEIAPLIDAHLASDAVLAGSGLASLLRPGRMPAIASSMILEDAYHKILEIFADERVPVAPLKGMDFAHRLYEAAHARTMCDIDILVPERDYTRARRVLGRTEGFEEVPFSQGTGEWERTSKDTAFDYTVGDHRSHIELHRRFGQVHHILVDYDALWGRARRVEGAEGADGQEHYLLAPEDVLLFTAYHLERSVFPTRLLWLVDLVGIAEQLVPDWEVVVRRAREWNFEVGLWHALCRVEGTLGVRVAPRWVFDTLTPGRLQAMYLQTIVPPDALVTPLDGVSVRKTQLLFWLPLMDNWPHRVHFAATYGLMRLRNTLG